MLTRNGREQPLIPRYFDLLVFLVERRGEAVHRRDIFDRVWSDVIVSDSALSQAIRTIRRVLGDDSREPRFVRTVSRHGYQFVFADVVEEDDEAGLADRETSPRTAPTTSPTTADPFEPLLQRLTRAAPAERGGRSARSGGAAACARHGRGAAPSRHAPAPCICASAAARYAMGRGGSRAGSDFRRAGSVRDRASSS